MTKRKPKFASLIPVQLTQVTTSDGVTLAGIVIEPRGKKMAALIFVHGLTSSFTGGHEHTRLYSDPCNRLGFGFFKFNNRGHDVVSKAGKKLAGGGFEKFTDCVKDIDAVIALARRRGYTKIILMGHSTGANKALYYTYRKPKHIRGLILTGPMSDVAGTYVTNGRAATQRLVRLAHVLAKKNPLAVMPIDGRIFTADRYISLHEPGHAEDVFPYYRQGGWKELRSVRCPLLVIIGTKDRNLDRPADAVLESFEHQARRSRAITTATIEGADHSFHDQEQSLVAMTEDWLRTVI